MSAYFIERNEDGTPDDVFLPAKSLRVERMSDGHVWLSLETDTGGLVTMNFTAKKAVKWDLEATDERWVGRRTDRRTRIGFAQLRSRH